jgi:glycosyltransferase involved in cell wall biosynthesis
LAIVLVYARWRFSEMKIVFLAPFGIRPKGTVLARMLPLAEEMQALGNQVVIVAPPYTNPEDSGRIETLRGVTLRNITLVASCKFIASPIITWRMFKATRAERPDLVHLFKPKGYGGLAAMLHMVLQRLGISLPPLFVDTDDWEGGGMNALHILCCRAPCVSFPGTVDTPHAVGVTVASRTLQTQAWGMGISPERTLYLPNGVYDLTQGDNKFNRTKIGIPADAPVVLIYTRFFEYDQKFLHLVFAEIYRQVPTVYFLVIGKGRNGEEAQLVDAAKKHGFSSALVMAGWVEPETIPEYLAAGDVSIYPFADTLVNRAKCPAKLTELLRAGIPVVAGRVGQIAEYIKPEVSGILCNPEDWREMAIRTVELLNDHARCITIGESGEAIYWSTSTGGFWRQVCRFLSTEKQMTERKKDFLFLLSILALLILSFSNILFTDKVIRAPDITNEFYWTIKHFKAMSFWDLFKVNLQAGWDIFANSGGSEGGGTLSLQFLFYRNLILWLFPDPANIAWFIVLHLFFGAAGTYLCCRAIGCSRFAALFAGVIFAIAPENASLINAGHVQKIATISFAPWAFYFFEKGFQTRRAIFFLTTGIILAFQFFNMHWQIAYYTCLGIGVYGILRSSGILFAGQNRTGKEFTRLFGLNLVTMLFFLSTVAISLLPLADWSKDTTRGIQNGANQGKGGLNVDEAMSWSLPPEELVSFVVPGFFGFSRQEGAYDTTNIKSYYWGRMVFTQTTDYMGLLPWLLLPLPLLFRRDAFTWLALTAVVGGILFSMGKYTPFYWFLYEHFPGINHFRVPKMMMFLPVLGLGVLAARGLDTLLDEEVKKTAAFKRYLICLLLFPVLLLVLLIAEAVGKDYWLSMFYETIAQPTRFEQGASLIAQRWENLLGETALAVAFSAGYAGVIFAFTRKWLTLRTLPLLLLALYCADAGRVNAKFMLLQELPEKVKGAKTSAMKYLEQDSKRYRVFPLNGTDPMQYASNRIPVMFTSNPVQQQRWQNFLDAFSFTSPMPDMLNVKYLIYDTAQYDRDKAQLGTKYQPVYQSPDRTEIILENRTVLPKGWLVPATALIEDPAQALAILRDQRFNPRQVALIETPPPIPLADPNLPQNGAMGEVSVNRYEGEHISVTAYAAQNVLLVLGEKYYRGWKATIDGKETEIYPVDHILRVYLHQEFIEWNLSSIRSLLKSASI